MQLDTTIQLYNLQQSIIDLINHSELPIGCCYFIIKDIYYNIETLYLNYISTKLQEEKEENSSIGQE